jgi:murein DD-endopeptidase MepM/ murein hydrolase activator NlpD
MFHLLFPQYKRRRWVYLPLGTLALGEQQRAGSNPLLDPEYCQQWVRRLHRRYQASCSYGGWFEDRATLWLGHYMRPGQMFHLGIDFNVPVNSRVYCPADAMVVEVWHDMDRNGGWGGRITLEIKPKLYLILAHLGRIRVRTGRTVRLGQLLGNVGNSTNNGNWFPHLHAQMVRGGFQGIDGYGEFSVRNQRKFPDPFRFWPPPCQSLKSEV